MELPKIPSDQLTPQLKKIVGNKDLEFDSIVDPMDVIDIDFNSDEYRESRFDIGKQILTIRNERQKNSKKINKTSEE